MQTKRRSVYESLTNIVIGLGLSIALNYVWLLYEGHDITWGQMTRLGVVMTIASFIRSYCIRRYYNWLDYKDEESEVGGTSPLSSRYYPGSGKQIVPSLHLDISKPRRVDCQCWKAF